MQKTVICTGANGGIGAQYCAEMVSQGYKVVLACRNATAGQALLENLEACHPDGSVELAIVDMGSVESIKAFAAEFQARHDRLDILVHNAGIYFFDKARKTSTDGIELNFAIHYVGPCVLTALLFDTLKSTAGSKVIAVTSTEHRGRPIDMPDIQLAHDFDGNMTAYARSKWAVLSFVYTLADYIQTMGLDMHALAAHPGVSITGIQHKGNPTRLQKLAIAIIGTFIAGKPKDAAKPLVLASREGQNDQFFGPTGFKEMKGPAGLVDPDPGTRDIDLGKALCEYVADLTGVEFPFIDPSQAH